MSNVKLPLYLAWRKEGMTSIVEFLATTPLPPTCHSIKAFQDGINLGDVYYAGVSVPPDIRQPAQ